MNKQELIQFWQKFFADLFLGTITNLILFGLLGMGLGLTFLLIFKSQVLGSLDWQEWIEMILLVLSFIWYSGWGMVSALILSILQTIGKKFAEAVGGLHDLLDLFTREVVKRIPKFSKTTPKDELDKQFDNIGKEFKEKLRLKKGILGWISSMIFGLMLKALKFFFLDDVVEELKKKPSGEITSSDMEHAVRRVGVGMILSPITDYIFILQIVIGVFLLLTFSMPFTLLWAT
jgi:hypothetical protein